MFVLLLYIVPPLEAQNAFQIHIHWILFNHIPAFFKFFSEATLSLPTISPLHPPLPLHCHPALHHQHWLMSWYRPQSQKLTPAVRWTGPTTPTNPDTASATRCVHVTSLSCSVLILASLLLLVILILE